MKPCNEKRCIEKRRGVVAVEFAVVAPLVFLFFFGAFEMCRVSMIRHTVDNAVYEAARVGIVPGATAADVRTEADRVLSTIGLRGYDVRVTPTNLQDATRVTVQIDVPVDRNSFVPAKYFIGKTIRRDLSLARERT